MPQVLLFARVGTLDRMRRNGSGFDVVLNLEVVEHVANPDQFLRDCARMVKPGGMMFVATINRKLCAEDGWREAAAPLRGPTPEESGEGVAYFWRRD